MSYYNPDPAAIIAQQQDERFVSFLSQRDVALQIPVNYVTYPGVVLTAACFANGRYEETAAAKCFSNLLATGFRRLEADVFWDVSRSVWSLCPVELGSADGPFTTSVSEASTSFDTATQLASDLLTNREADAAPTGPGIFERQSSNVLTAPTFMTSARSTPSITSTRTIDAPLIPTVLPSYSHAPDPVPSDVSIIQAGPYSCTFGADLALLVKVLSEHLDSTETDLNATTTVLTLNLHAAASAHDPAGSAQAPTEDQLPDPGSLLSSVIASNASVYLYTNNDLESQRSDLNNSKSWFTVLRQFQPEASYFQVNDNRGTVSTPDGWPDESYIEMQMQNSKRLLVGFGEVDPQMSGYNFSGDENIIFPPNYIEMPRAATFTSNDIVDSGCFFDPNVTELTRLNSSWALTALGNGTAPTGEALTSLLLQARNLTACGISAIINGTLNNATADENFEAYAAFVDSTIWSWAPGQPTNSSASEEYENYHCAALNATSGYWQAADCSSSLYGACRIENEPYRWQISDANAPYGRVDLGCDDNTTFSVPRTALENAYLLAAWRDFRSDGDDDDDDGWPLVWMDLNDLDVTSCWVIGQNTTCPYDGPPTTRTREIAVPVVGGVIVLVLAVLTVLVKCAGNRRNSKRRRRRGDGGWDYEGVPS